MKKPKSLDLTPQRLKELREKNGMNQEEFSKTLGLVRQSVGLYELGTRTPDAGLLFDICEKYNVSADWLLGLSDIMNRDVADIDTYTASEKYGLSQGSLDLLSAYVQGHPSSDESERRKTLLKITNLLIEHGCGFLQCLGEAVFTPLVIDEGDKTKSQQERKDHFFLTAIRKLDLFYNRFINRR